MSKLHDFKLTVDSKSKTMFVLYSSMSVKLFQLHFQLSLEIEGLYVCVRVYSYQYSVYFSQSCFVQALVDLFIESQQVISF